MRMEANVYRVTCPKNHIYSIYPGNPLEDRCAAHSIANPHTPYPITENECEMCTEQARQTEEMINGHTVDGWMTW